MQKNPEFQFLWLTSRNKVSNCFPNVHALGNVPEHIKMSMKISSIQCTWSILQYTPTPGTGPQYTIDGIFAYTEASFRFWYTTYKLTTSGTQLRKYTITEQ